MRLARAWLSRCLKDHWCNFNLREIPLFPTRLINVGPPDGSEEPFLCMSKGYRGVYLALSHSWGPSQIITTTLATINERSIGISFSSLPKTFQDAIKITRAMDWRYLWIDSLCIIQDSIEDWELESAKMGDYYKNALVTIAAVSAKGGEESCFRKRNMLQVTLLHTEA